MRFLMGIILLISLSAVAEDAKIVPSASGTIAMTAAEVAATVAENAAAEKASTVTDAKTEGKSASLSPKESEIPLNLDVPKKAGDESHPFFKFLLAVSLMGIVAVGAYFFFRKYSKTNFSAGKHNQIKVLTQHYLGPKKSLAIIRVAGESILVGITDQNISMIKSLSLMDDELPENTPQEFAGLIQHENEYARQDVAFNLNAEEEEFSIRGIKDVVSKKLKGMRSLQ